MILTFSATNTAANPTLNINGTGAKAIRYRNAAIAAGHLAVNRFHEFIYDGTYWQYVGDLDTNTTYSAATTSANGLMASGDKTNLNNAFKSVTVSGKKLTFTRVGGGTQAVTVS